MLWGRYALLRGKPVTSVRAIYASHLESPGTKAYSVAQARALFAGFRETTIQVRPGTGDLLLGAAGDRHGGTALRLLRKVWPRRLIETFLPRVGLVMMIEARK